MPQVLETLKKAAESQFLRELSPAATVQYLRWSVVPRKVAELLPAAERVAARSRQLALLHAVGDVRWDPLTKTADFGAAEISADVVALPELVRSVGPVRGGILVKRAAQQWWSAPFRAAGMATGGPTPLTNAIVGGLVGGGLGYGAGWLAEKFLPEEQFEPGRLRKTLGLAGAGIGVGLPLLHGIGRYYGAQNEAGAPGLLRSMVTPTAALPASSQAAAFRPPSSGLYSTPTPPADGDMTLPTREVARKVSAFGAFTGGDDIRPVPVDRFNRAIWEGTSPTLPDPTPPEVAAAAAGLVSGVAAQYGAPSLLSPQHFVRGLATAGVDAVTATVAGNVLGALGGLRPQAQRELQRAGFWTGLVRGVTGSIFGLR